MPITPFLSGQVFEPEARHDPATELVAKTIIKLAQQGVRDVDALLKAALKEFDLDK